MTAVESAAPQSPRRPRFPSGWRGSGWIVASSIALLAISRWLSATSVEYLVIAATATAVAGALAFGLESSPRPPATGTRRWAVACAACLALAFALGANAQHRLARLQRGWASERTRISGDALETLARDIDRSLAELRALATRALGAPGQRRDAFQFLDDGRHDDQHAVVLFRGDSALAWSGRPRVPVDSLPNPFGVVGTPFYLALYSSADTGTQRAVATRLLYAVPPADRMVQSLGGEVAKRAGVAAFRFVPPRDSAALGDGARVVRDQGSPLFAVRADPLTQGEVQLRLLARA